MLIDEKELLKRDAERNIGEELLQAIRDIKSDKIAGPKRLVCRIKLYSLLLQK